MGGQDPKDGDGKGDKGDQDNRGKGKKSGKSVAIIGAGASGAITAAAFGAESYFDRIVVFERRGTAGGTWIYDPVPKDLTLVPGAKPPESDKKVEIPGKLRDGETKRVKHVERNRWDETPIYRGLTTNVPSIAMSFSDLPFAYGTFVPHWIPRQYIESYLSHHGLDHLVQFNTTVENITLVSPPPPSSPYSEGDSLGNENEHEVREEGRNREGKGKEEKEGGEVKEEKKEKWKLTLRRYDALLGVDEWWEEVFDGVMLANGHYSVPFIPDVPGLNKYQELYPGKVVHSKTYRTPELWRNKKVVVIGNSASGHDVTAELVGIAHPPVIQSRRTASRWDGSTPPPGISWRPVIKEFLPNGDIIFSDSSILKREEVDTVIYCTGYLPSFPFWDEKQNGAKIWDYEKNKLENVYLHTFFPNHPRSLGIVGLPRVLTFRSFEYQAIALSRLFSSRESLPLPSIDTMKEWEEKREKERLKQKGGDGRKYHDIEWETGETWEWFKSLSGIAGLGGLGGEGRRPPILGERVRWEVENRRKYPEPGRDGGGGKGKDGKGADGDKGAEEEGLVMRENGRKKDLLAFI